LKGDLGKRLDRFVSTKEDQLMKKYTRVLGKDFKDPTELSESDAARVDRYEDKYSFAAQRLKTLMKPQRA